MTRPIAHIGFHKTATGWFQNCVYPRVTSHRLIDRDIVRQLFVNGDAFHFDADQARAELGIGAEAFPPLICEEELSGILHIGAASTYIAKEVASRLHSTLPDAQIVIFVRSQVAAAVSWYMQYLKEGGTASLRRYLFPDEYVYPGRFMHLKTARFDFSQLDYSGLIQVYDELFGPENVHVLLYEDIIDGGDAVVADMQGRLKLELARGPIPTGAVNRSFRRGLTPVARLLNLFSARGVANKRTLIHVPFGNRAARFILEQLNAVPIFGSEAKAGSLIDRRTAQWIEQRFAASNRWLQQRTGRDLGGLGYGLNDAPPTPSPTRSRLLRWTRM